MAIERAITINRLNKIEEYYIKRDKKFIPRNKLQKVSVKINEKELDEKVIDKFRTKSKQVSLSLITYMYKKT